MPRIESPSNPRVTAVVRALSRGELLPLEGARMLGEALDAGVVPEAVFYEPIEENAALAEKAAETVKRAEAAGAEIFEVSRRVVEKLSDLSSSRGVVAVAPIPDETGRAAGLGPSGVALVLDGVQDPANVGAILRSAEAFGAFPALLTSGSASPFSARALRASAGSAFRLPVSTGLSASDVVSWAAAAGATLVGADAHEGKEPAAIRGAGPIALVIGSEGHGISEALSAALSRRVRLALTGKVESLNAAVAASLLLYELSRAT